MPSIEARAMETEYEQVICNEISLGGLRITGVEVRPLGVSEEDWKKLLIPKGTRLRMPVAESQPIGFTDKKIDDGTLVSLLSKSTAVVFPAKHEMEVGYEDAETLASVDGPSLTYLLNTFARLHGGALSFHSDDFLSISVEGTYWNEDRLVVDRIRFIEN